MDINKIEGVAKMLMEMQGHHAPQVILDLGTTVEFDLIIIKRPQDKQTTIELLRQKVERQNIKEYVLIIEGYKHVIDKETKKKIQTDDCIQISKFRKDMENETITLIFEKKDNKIIWKERIHEKPFTGYTRWNVYIEDVVDEVVKQRLGDDFEL